MLVFFQNKCSKKIQMERQSLTNKSLLRVAYTHFNRSSIYLNTIGQLKLTDYSWLRLHRLIHERCLCTHLHAVVLPSGMLWRCCTPEDRTWYHRVSPLPHKAFASSVYTKCMYGLHCQSCRFHGFVSDSTSTPTFTVYPVSACLLTCTPLALLFHWIHRGPLAMITISPWKPNAVQCSYGALQHIVPGVKR